MEPKSGGSAITAHLADRQMRFKQIRDQVTAILPAKQPGGLFRFITISRQLGSYGTLIAEDLATQLDWHMFDREIVDHIARDQKVRQSLVEQLDERAQDLLHDTVRRFLTMVEGNSFGLEEYRVGLLKTMAYLAAKGNAILVGRGANFALREEKHGLHIRIVASRDVRVDRMSRLLQVNPQEARKRVMEADRERASFVRSHYRQDIGDGRFYDLVFNTDSLAIEAVVNAILAVVRSTETA
jgi:cytidylate kinase-like protein